MIFRKIKDTEVSILVKFNNMKFHEYNNSYQK